MADGFKDAMKVIDVLDKGCTLASSFDAVNAALQIFGTFAKGFSFFGAALGLIDAFLPDAKQEEILRCFEILGNKIDQVRDEIKNLEKMIKWEATKIQYAEAVERIQLAMQFSLEMGKASKEGDKAKYERFQQRLKEVCSNQELTLALDALLDGIAGKGLFYSSIFDNLYSETGGHRSKISALAFRLLQIVSGGMIVLATYEASVRGKDAADEMVNLYEPRMEEAKGKIDEDIQRCINEFPTNMLNDINNQLDSGGDNEYVCNNIFTLMKEKYDWLENRCVVYNDLCGFDKHCFNGDRVESLHHNGKCSIVFYRTASDAPIYSDRVGDVEGIIGDDYFSDARERYNAIVAELDKAGIGWSGCAVIRSHVTERNNMSSKAVVKVFDQTERCEVTQFGYPVCVSEGYDGTIIVILQ